MIEQTDLKQKELGFMDNGTGKHQSNTVYDVNYLAPCITTVKDGGTIQIKILVGNETDE